MSKESTDTLFNTTIQLNQDVERLDSGSSPTKDLEEVQKPYSVFSSGRILLIVVISSSAGMISPLSANIYFPALNAIQADFGTSAELVNLTVTLYMVFQGISPAFWGSLADVWGRRPVYLMTLIIYIGACVGLAESRTYWLLLVLRMLQAFGSSSVVAIGAGIVSDISDSSRRGTYFGIYSTGQLLGPVIGPVIGGIVSESISWRFNFWILFIIGAVVFLLILFLIPETLRALVGDGSGYANPTPTQWIKRQRQRKAAKKSNQPSLNLKTTNQFRIIPNFILPFHYLIEPDVFMVLLYNGLHYSVMYCFLVSTPSLFKDHYGLSEIQVGLCFLCQGFGSLIGSLSNGKLLDRDFKYLCQKLGLSEKRDPVTGSMPIDFPIHYVRLRLLWINASLIQSVTIIYGWCININAPLGAILFLQFIAGFSAVSILTTSQTLLVDLFPGKGASITASNNLVRCILGAVATVAIDPGIQGIGTGWMFTILGLILIVSNIIIYILLQFGPRWRKKRFDNSAAQ
ncbi:major facilitator superfamily domain-containing protein [Phycomyces nitens]|nr:major facilitator superfamily domain-containing protein [Phycomyces nitens]